MWMLGGVEAEETLILYQILTRLYRDFVHVYVHHFDRLMSIGAEPHVNTCYKHFYYFVTEFSLINDKEFEPLKVSEADLLCRCCQVSS